MKTKGLNASSTQQYFWQQMTAKVFPHLNKTISVWRADDPNRGAFASNLPQGSVANVYQSLQTAWQQTLPAGVKTVVSMAGDSWYLDGECGGCELTSPTVPPPVCLLLSAWPFVWCRQPERLDLRVQFQRPPDTGWPP